MKLIHAASPFIYLLALLVPKRRDLWLFGAWFGEKYSDNSKYLFEYVHNHLDSVSAIWITKNPQVVAELRRRRLPVLHAFSLKGVAAQLRAGTFVMSVNSNDFLFSTLTPRSRQIQLWHGSPIKKICFDAWNGPEYLKNRLRHWLVDRYTHVISPSAEVDRIFSSAFRMPASAFIRSPYPRCEALFSPSHSARKLRHELGIPESHKLVAYLPTHRAEGKDPQWSRQLFETFLNSGSQLEGENISILCKPHFYDQPHVADLDSNPPIHMVSADLDTYELLSICDGLITDISSIAFDYDMTGHPIFFYMPDLERFTQNDRELYFSIQDIADPLHENLSSLIEALARWNRGSPPSPLKLCFNEKKYRNICERLTRALLPESLQ